MRDVTTFLLAGGEGARLYPLTRDRSKPAVPFGGHYRLIDFTLSNCVHSGIARIGVLTQYKSDSLTRHLGAAWGFFRPQLGEYLNILPPQLRNIREFYRGTADAVYQNLNTIRREGPRDVLILSGDHVYAMDYRPFLERHREANADLTIATIPVPRSEAVRFGILREGKGGRVVEFTEKPRDLSAFADVADGGLDASMGVYLFKAGVLARELEDGPGRDERFDFGRDIIPAMVGRARVFIHRFARGAADHTNYWRDVGTLDSYHAAQMDLLSPDGLFHLSSPTWPILTGLPPRAPARIGSPAGGRVEDCLVCEGCAIAGTARHSIIGPDVVVDRGAVVEDSVLLSGVHIERDAIVRRAVLDKAVRVRRGGVVGLPAGNRGVQTQGKIVHTPGGVAVVAKGDIVGPERRTLVPSLALDAGRIIVDREIEVGPAGRSVSLSEAAEASPERLEGANV
ncbi:MAG: glucose-1-phosphate adenylyltransferase [Planctomycetes bacterium]|nr:glucose-1-phosphate adenylyltransferase [Planctomycetota bacterium]